MIDSGVSSSVMPKQITDVLGIQYALVARGVVQLDDTAVKTVVVIKGLQLTINACPSFSFIQDISVIDLPPLFAIFLSRDFIAKMGSYLSADWSHMILRTRYGTKLTIRVEPICHNHVEPYTASPINGNYTIGDPEEEDADHEPTTLVEEVPDTFMDEVSRDHQYDPYADVLVEEEV
ncbi:hypothetical protein KI387_032860, partial [Taxus chinensis]